MAYEISPNALNGFANAGAYEKYRPSYRQESFDSLLSGLEISGVQGARVLEIGAGTGKWTSLLAASRENFEIIAVEPHREMLQILEEKGLRGVRVAQGSATKMESVPDGWADAVIVAQAFHWFASREALKEIHKKLKPRGSLGLIWNVEDYNSEKEYEVSTKWEQDLKNLVWSFEDLSPRYRHNKWREPFENQSTALSIGQAPFFFSMPLKGHILKWTVWLKPGDIWCRVRTLSHISVLEGEQLKATESKVKEALRDGDVEMNDRGEIALHGRTIAHWASAVPTLNS